MDGVAYFYRARKAAAPSSAAPSAYRRHGARQRNPELRSARAKRDEGLMGAIERVWQANLEVYGADKVWKQLNREGVSVVRCTVERLMGRPQALMQPLGYIPPAAAEANYSRQLASRDALAA